MSDYLGALISRAYDALDVVRPRPVSRFERQSPELESVPRGGAVALVAREPDSITGARGLPVGIASPDPGVAEHRQRATAVAAPGEVSAFFPHDDALRVRRLQTTESPVPRVTTTTPAPLSPRASDAGVKQASTPQPERIEAGPAATTPMRQTRIQPIRREVIVERQAEPGKVRPPTPSQPSHATTLAVLPAAGLPHPIPNSPPRPIESAAVIEPRLAAQASQRSAPPSEPPAIHVTIGRIEIRATSPAASPVRRQHREPSVMSLDEYLKQRARGGPR